MLVDTGGVTENAASPNVFAAMVNCPNTGVARVTVRAAVVEPASNNELAGCDTVMLVVPAETSVTNPVDAFTVATLVSLLA